MTQKRQNEIVELAKRTLNYPASFIFDGNYNGAEIEYFLNVRASLNASPRR